MKGFDRQSFGWGRRRAVKQFADIITLRRPPLVTARLLTLLRRLLRAADPTPTRNTTNTLVWLSNASNANAGAS